MFESHTSLLPFSKTERFKSYCVGFETESLEELHRLLETLGSEVVGETLVHLRNINPRSYVGEGKLEEIRHSAQSSLADCIVFDCELSPSQLKNIEKDLTHIIVDRPGVILEIFSRHANSKEAQTQVEVARIHYLLPRLQHFWTHFERQRGGIGLKGMGEKQIEVDRRLLRVRLQSLQSRLKKIGEARTLRRKHRTSVHKVALVGYTNAGKSTLLNAMTNAHVRAEDKLFATLDASVRALDPHSHPPVVAIDTVGFIRNIPHALIASFRSTLEEAHDADLLVHVLDASSPALMDQKKVTEEVLAELELDQKPRLTVLNKIDRLPLSRRSSVRVAAPGAMLVSALNTKDVARLRDKILEHFEHEMAPWEIVLPYESGRLESLLHEHGKVEQRRFLKKGVFLKLRIHPLWAEKLRLEKYRV